MARDVQQKSMDAHSELRELSKAIIREVRVREGLDPTADVDNGCLANVMLRISTYIACSTGIVRFPREFMETNTAIDLNDIAIGAMQGDVP